jgi:hypothetical protein
MHTATHRLTVVGCALSWLMVGMHLPKPHQIMRHGWPSATILTVLSLLTGVAVAASWLLLREAGRAGNSSYTGSR